ncbi:hypothetical protein HQ32_01473 [Prauserella sp. Am3]|nr:hypothetical protein HQ32_01473 [Prauserella sp. Am3]
MKPAVKYAAVAALHSAGPNGLWEHELFSHLKQHYRLSELVSLREDLVGLATVGWLQATGENWHDDQLLRRYALVEGIRPVAEFQLKLHDIESALGNSTPAATARARGGSR